MTISISAILSIFTVTGGGFQWPATQSDFDDNGADPSSTDLKLFEREMKYLHENGFKIITMADLGYNEESHHL